MKKPVKKFGSRMKEGGVVDKVKEAAKDYADVYSKSARELGETASEIGSSAVQKAKEVGSAVAKEARNYGRLYKEGLGMKPDTPYEKKDGGMIKAKTKKFPDLTGDGKVTRADVLKGRGVYKSGGSVPKGMHRMPDGSLMKNSEHKGQAMKKPVKKFGGGMMKAIGEAVKRATGPMAQRAASGPVGGVAQMAAEAAPMAAARPQGRGLMGRVAQMAAEAAKNAPVAAARPQGRGVLGRVAQVAASALAKRARPGGMKKGGAVTKKSVKKTTRKK